MKKVTICFLGIILSFILLSLFVYINVNFTEANEFAKEDYTERMIKNPSENPYERLQKTTWRFDYLFNPLIVIVVSLTIFFIDKSRFKIILALIALLPFLIFYLLASSFSIRSFFFAVCYVCISLIMGLLLPKKEKLLSDGKFIQTTI